VQIISIGLETWDLCLGPTSQGVSGRLHSQQLDATTGPPPPPAFSNGYMRLICFM
jgi:hypothetical protein